MLFQFLRQCYLLVNTLELVAFKSRTDFSRDWFFFSSFLQFRFSDLVAMPLFGPGKIT